MSDRRFFEQCIEAARGACDLYEIERPGDMRLRRAVNAKQEHAAGRLTAAQLYRARFEATSAHSEALIQAPESVARYAAGAICNFCHVRLTDYEAGQIDLYLKKSFEQARAKP
jgi:hypothetical protein